jgi:hypothetical protein
MAVFVKSSKSLVNATAELWNGFVPLDEIKKLPASSDRIINWQITSRNSFSTEEPSFTWQVDKAGYFIFRIVDDETPTEDFDITLDLRFYNYFELKVL